MVRVYSAQVLVLVENMKNILKMHDIESRITNQYLSAAVGEIPPNEAWPQLWVSEQDAAHAEKIVEEALQESPESQEVRICPTCGEAVECQFAECWNCGTVLN